jgi:hypothetical protein
MLIGCATDDYTDDDWTAITQSESLITFRAADSASDDAARYKLQTNDYSRTIEIVYWSAASSEVSRAEVVYSYLAPHSYFRSGIDLDQAISRLSDFEGFDIERGEVITDGGTHGVVASQLLYLDQIVTCVVFTRFWGNAGFAPPNGGTQYFYGYYCVDPGEDFTVADAKAVLATLEVRPPPTESALPAKASLFSPSKRGQGLPHP